MKVAEMPFLRNAWYVAMWSEMLGPEAIEARTILSEPVALFRTADGAPAAVLDICPHRFAALSMGRRVAEGIECAYHGLRFGPDGGCVFNPHTDGRIPSKARVRRFPVVEKDTLIWIWMGEGEGDPAAIPDFSFLDPAEGFSVTRRERIDMPVDYRLIINNLLALSHVSFLHDGILGNLDSAQSADITIDKTDDSVAVTRISKDIPIPQLFALLLNDGSERGDLWNTIEWRLPGALKNSALITHAGADPLDGAGILAAHLLTPETENSTVYHIAAARQKTRRAIDPVKDEAVRDDLARLRRFAFEEQDLPMILAQAKRMRDYPEATRWPVFLDIDAAPAAAQKILKERIADEQER